MSTPRNGTTTMRAIQPAFAHPDMSRRKMSAKTAMNAQMTVNQKKKTSMPHRNVPNDQSTMNLLSSTTADHPRPVVHTAASSSPGEGWQPAAEHDDGEGT